VTLSLCTIIITSIYSGQNKFTTFSQGISVQIAPILSLPTVYRGLQFFKKVFKLRNDIVFISKGIIVKCVRMLFLPTVYIGLQPLE